MDMFELEKASGLMFKLLLKLARTLVLIVGPDFKRNDAGQILINPSTGLPEYDKSNHVLENASWKWTGGVTTTLTYKKLITKCDI